MNFDLLKIHKNVNKAAVQCTQYDSFLYIKICEKQKWYSDCSLVRFIKVYGLIYLPLRAEIIINLMTIFKLDSQLVLDIFVTLFFMLNDNLVLG